MSKSARFTLTWLLAATTLALTPLVSAQNTFDAPRGEFIDLNIDTGEHTNAGDQAIVAFSKVIQHENALWVRLHFTDVALAPGSTVRITSLLDNEVQELDTNGLAMWSNASAFFNGDAVLFELFAAPGTKDNRVIVSRAMVDLGDPGHPINPCGICGEDTRVPSSELWSGRLAPNGCTASIFNTNSCVVSAGHCMGGNNAVHFNVPPSLPNCNTQNPPVADQFPITNMLFQNGGVGADWAVMTLGTNNLGQTPYERYGVYVPLATSVANVGAPVSVWGYGMNQVKCVQNYAQQLSEGVVNAVFQNYYRAHIDVTFGNSGSGLIHDDSIIGIVTHCDSCANGNIMNRIDTPAFANAIISLCPPPPPENDSCAGAIAVGSGNTSFSNVSATTTGPDEPNACNYAGSTNVEADIWYSHKAECNGTLFVRLCNSNPGFDTKLAVYGDTCPTQPGTALACNKDHCNQLSQVTLPVTVDSTYHIRIGGHNGATGSGVLTIVCMPDPDPPCPGDLDGDGVVGVSDLLALLSAWGACPPAPGDCPADLDGDGSVGVSDLLILLGNWGPCD